MKRVFLWTVLLTGCATQSAIMPEGKDSYLLIMSGGYGLASSVDLRIDAHQAAAGFCSKLGKRPETVFEKTTQSETQSDFREEELKFRCVGESNMPSSAVTETATPASAVHAVSADAH